MRKLAEDEADLAGVDIVLLQLLERRLVEVGAMRTGRGGIFDDRHLGVLRPQRHFADRPAAH